MKPFPETNTETAETLAQTLALRALVWTLAEPNRAHRLLDTTGLTPADLRARAGDPEVLGAALGFLQAHQPDLLACAAELEVAPEQLVRAQEALS
jgi:2-hydroxychromene-2-carboxylate isomerase